VTLNSHTSTRKRPHKPSPTKGRISSRFRNINIMLFTLAFCIIAGVMSTAFNSVIKKLSSQHAGRYAVSSAEEISTHINKVIALIAKTARSEAVTDWLLDENNDLKKATAYEKMADIVWELHSFNLYIGLEGSRHEYKVGKGYTIKDFLPATKLNKNNPANNWYFECIASDKNYLISLSIDNVMKKKRLWLNYKVVKNGVLLGVIRTELEFSHVAIELFSKYDDSDIRGLVIDEKGAIHMDSSLMSNKYFLHSDFETQIENEFFDPALLTTIKRHLDGIEGYFDIKSEPVAIELSSSRPYRYMTIVPIRSTTWSVVMLSGTPSLFNISLFVPISATVLILLIVFALTTNITNYRLIFMPLEKLNRSLAQLKDNHNAHIYGIERNDELGELSKTIQDLFTKANVDALTGIYNRRYMESNLYHIMKFLARSNSLMSILILDVDYFKNYNDTYGHEQGDICLKEVARVLAGSITRTSDFAARYGGEEFVVVLPNTNEAGARSIAVKLLENIRDLNIPHSNSAAAPYVTISIGITTGRVRYLQSWENYLKYADEALYMSKQNGRNQYTYLAYPEKPI